MVTLFSDTPICGDPDDPGILWEMDGNGGNGIGISHNITNTIWLSGYDIHRLPWKDPAIL